MNPVIAMPRARRGQKLAFSLDEDEVTLSWEAVRKARLPPGTKVAAQDFVLPAWWWQGLGLVADDAAPLVIRPIATTLGTSVCVHERGPPPDVQADAQRLHLEAPAPSEADWQRVRLARESPDTEADFPLGAFIPQPRHDEVLARRMLLGEGRVETWTTIGAGAAPTEFVRLQAAQGDYHVVLVRLADGRATVGMWTEPTAPTTGLAARPVLRRLFRTQGAWRYGVKFAPALK